MVKFECPWCYAEVEVDEVEDVVRCPNCGELVLEEVIKNEL